MLERGLAMKASSWGPGGLVNRDVIRCSMTYVPERFHVSFGDSRQTLIGGR